MGSLIEPQIGGFVAVAGFAASFIAGVGEYRAGQREAERTMGSPVPPLPAPFGDQSVPPGSS